jgi:hypothetical protein
MFAEKKRKLRRSEARWKIE